MDATTLCIVGAFEKLAKNAQSQFSLNGKVLG